MILLVLAVSSLILVSFMLPLALLLRSFAADRAVSAAQIQAQDMATLVATLNPAALGSTVAQVNAQNPSQAITIFLQDGQRLGVRAARSSGVELAARSGGSFTERVPGGVAVFAAVLGLPKGPVVIRTFVPDAQLHRGVTQAWMLLGAVALGLLVLAVIVTIQLTRSLVRPLGNVAMVAEQLAQGDLTARAPVDGPPEIRQVSNGLNRLAARIGELLTHERETLADLSHRLRTPLTALRIDAESLYGDEEMMTRVIGDVDALTRTVNEIISEARRPTSDAAGATCDATAVVRERAAFWRALAEDQERWMTVEIPPHTLPVRVPDQDLAACVDILLENVFSHTPDGTAFSVRVSQRAAGGAWLVVSDNGPGFSHPDPARRGQSTRGSTGLGLDIARRIAEGSGGTLTLGRSPHGGGAVTIGLGPAAGPVRKPRRHVRTRRPLHNARAAEDARITAELSEWAVIADRDPEDYWRN
ncbi:MAG TPA: HAMP domain-containing sensor histidine kinase [Streptosporangiaceae bacterium]|nr:HAMP domain-containing sensor histidine kinase [Streptosporangiaceae bacterium]